MIASATRPGRSLCPRSLQAIARTCHVVERAQPQRVSNLETQRVCRKPLAIRAFGSSATSFPATGDTIYALSTGAGRAGIAVIRISGPSSLDVSNSPKPNGCHASDP
jgi:tRNA modification GTPase